METRVATHPWSQLNTEFLIIRLFFTMCTILHQKSKNQVPTSANSKHIHGIRWKHPVHKKSPRPQIFDPFSGSRSSRQREVPTEPPRCLHLGEGEVPSEPQACWRPEKNRAPGWRNGVNPWKSRVSLRRNVLAAFFKTPASRQCEHFESSMFSDLHFKDVRLGGLTPHRSPFGEAPCSHQTKTTLILQVNLASPASGAPTEDKNANRPGPHQASNTPTSPRNPIRADPCPSVVEKYDHSPSHSDYASSSRGERGSTRAAPPNRDNRTAFSDCSAHTSPLRNRPPACPRSSFLVPRSSHIQRTHFPDMAHIDAAGRAAKDLSACTSSRGKVLTARSSGHGEGVTPSRWQVWARLRVETRHS